MKGGGTDRPLTFVFLARDLDARLGHRHFLKDILSPRPVVGLAQLLAQATQLARKRDEFRHPARFFHQPIQKRILRIILLRQRLPRPFKVLERAIGLRLADFLVDQINERVIQNAGPFLPKSCCKGLNVKPMLDLAQARVHVNAMLIFKIFREQEWADLRASGKTQGAPVDIADGFVHFSTAEQVEETAAKHFAGEDGLFLLGLETDRLGDALKWEPSRGGALFPHLYRDLTLEDVAWAQPLPLENGTHQFPAGLGT